MTIRQKLQRSNLIMGIIFVISVIIFTVYLNGKEHIVSSISAKDSIGLIMVSTLSLGIIISLLFYLPMLVVVKFTFNFPSLGKIEPLNNFRYTLNNVFIYRTQRQAKLCVFRC